MSMEELDHLRAQNLERIRQIEQKYFEKREQFSDQNFKKLVKEKVDEVMDQRDIKEKRIDSSLNYPTYGRKMDPKMEIDTFMINKSLC